MESCVQTSNVKLFDLFGFIFMKFEYRRFFGDTDKAWGIVITRSVIQIVKANSEPTLV